MTSRPKLSTTTPTNLSPEFTDWLIKEKQEAHRYRMRIVKATAFVLICSAAFLLKDQIVHVLALVDQAHLIAQP